MDSTATLVLCTTNAGKLRELAELLTPLGIPCCSLAGLDAAVDVEETGSSFTENAALKASQQARALGRFQTSQFLGALMWSGNGRLLRSILATPGLPTPAGTSRSPVGFEPIWWVPGMSKHMPSDATELLEERATARRFASHGEKRPKLLPQTKGEPVSGNDRLAASYSRPSLRWPPAAAMP